jgi:riboflavin transporter
MNSAKTLTITRTNIVVFLVLATAATLAPLSRNQFITGTIVNCALFTGACSIGIRAALLIGIVPGTVALSTGLLPSMLSPMIPFVILGNAVLVITFDYFRKFNYWLGAVAASALKYGLLTAAASIVTNLVINKDAAAGVAYMMSWPQLVTALSGSLAAFGILSMNNRINKSA